MRLLLPLFVLILGCNHTDTPKEKEPAAVPQMPKTAQAPQTAQTPQAAQAAAPETKTPEPTLETMPAPGELKAIHDQANAKPEDGTTTLLMLADLQFVADTGQTPEGYFFRGVMKNGLFVPDDKGLQGNTAIPVGGTPGWVELHTGKFLPAMTSRAPAEPFIEGRMTPAGFFPNQPKLKTE